MNPVQADNKDSREPDFFLEGQMLSNYLVNESAPVELLDRYVQANGMLLSEMNDSEGQPIVYFVRRHPWSLPYMDAILGILHPQTLLRKKILLMVALLEASPKYTEHFISGQHSIIGFWVRMAQYGLSSLIKMMIGLCIYPFAIHVK